MASRREFCAWYKCLKTLNCLCQKKKKKSISIPLPTGVTSWVHLSHLTSDPALPFLTDPYQVSPTGPTSLKITQRQPLSTIQEDIKWPGLSSTYNSSWPNYYKTSGPVPWQEPPSKTWPCWCLNCGFREPSTTWLHMKLVSLLSFSTSFYILMNTVPPQIQATTNLGPFSLHPNWPLPVSLTITALLILILAIGLVTVSPQDWPPILRLSVGIACVASCVLLLGCYFLGTAWLTSPWLLCSLSLLHSPAFWLLPALRWRLFLCTFLML